MKLSDIAAEISRQIERKAKAEEERNLCVASYLATLPEQKAVEAIERELRRLRSLYIYIQDHGRPPVCECGEPATWHESQGFNPPLCDLCFMLRKQD